jgi:hypothetical protein
MFISKSKISYPITLSNDIAFVKRNLSIDINETEDDEFVNQLIESATELTEGQINQDIAYTSNIVTLDDFSGCDLIINQGNLNTITSIINNDTSTAITAYESKKSYSQFTISFDPAIDCESLTINFTTGWVNASDVPKALKQAILSKTLGLYNHTDSYDSVWETFCNQHKLL